MNDKEADAILRKHITQLGEHFDTVQILVSNFEGGSTTSRAYGHGNWFARVGMARAFVYRDEQEDLAKSIARQITPPDDGENWKQEAES